VRSLAQKSAEASRDIKTLIESSVLNVEHGSKFVAQTGAALDSINGSIKKVSDIVSEIAAASAEQSTGIEQVNRAISSLDQVTQQNAALVEETSAAAGSLNDQSAHLKDLMGFFSVDGNMREEASTRLADNTENSAAKKGETVPKRTQTKGISQAEQEPASKAPGKIGVKPAKAVNSPSTRGGDDWSEF
jgi:ABC-type transporter Mla subunit MlaD